MITTYRDLHTVADQDGAAILDVERGLISTLNPTGAYVWAGIQRGEPVETIVSGLALETGTKHSVVDRDVREFLADLTANRLLAA